MTTMRITQADIDLAKLVIRAAESIGEEVEPDIRILAAATPSESHVHPGTSGIAPVEEPRLVEDPTLAYWQSKAAGDAQQ